ncbi:MAG: DUF3772 domain-containing protein [Rhodobacteraceae bacterium]|nr:DUF3772 domain-containing protein [Paracoccaceae bacterium]
MPFSAERARGSGGFAGLLRALTLALLLGAGWAGAGHTQDATPGAAENWDETIAQAQGLAGDPDASTVALELLRDRLLRMRSTSIEIEAEAAGRVADVNARLSTLGPAPAEGVTESDEIAQRRAQINAELSAAQAPLLEAQDFQRRADALIRDIDRVVRSRFADELRSQGPTPLRPIYWVQTAEALAENFRARRAQLEATLSDPVQRNLLLRRIPQDLLLAIIGVGIAFSLRLRLVRWVEDALSRATSAKTIALLVALRNFSKLIVPAIGAGLFFGALNPAALVNPAAPSAPFYLPDFVLAIIAASWLGSSVFAPKLPAFRLAPVETADATTGARVNTGLGLVLAAHLFVERYVADFDMSPAEAATLVFPLFVIGGPLLWGMSRVLRAAHKQLLARAPAAPSGERSGTIGLSVLRVIERGVWVIAFAAPTLAAAGYLAAGTYLLYSAILTLGLLGAGVVLFDLATTTLGAVVDRRGAAVRDLAKDGLVPVLVAALLGFAALPLLALIWGARGSDIADVWFMLRDGVTFGGMRISIGMIVSFALVFGALYGAARVLQSVLRNTVLPRTGMDAGGKNAVLAGVGYAGFFIATIAAVSSTGLDLTSLAFVAGALSVGIGFGLQNIVSNFVSGIILLVERPIKEGDWIEVGGFSGYVRDISVRSTEIETFDRASVILPNSDLVAGTVLNRTHSGMSGRIQVVVNVAMESDAREVERVLLDIAESHPLVLTAPSPRVLLMEVGPDTLLFEIRCWLRDVNFSLSARSDINFEILERFAAEDIRLQPFLRDARSPPPSEREAPPAEVEGGAPLPKAAKRS